MGEESRHAKDRMSGKCHTIEKRCLLRTYICNSYRESSLIGFDLLISIPSHSHHPHRQVIQNHVYFILILYSRLKGTRLILAERRNAAQNMTHVIVEKQSLRQIGSETQFAVDGL